MSGSNRHDRFRRALERRPLLLDAAMGTRLIAQGLDLARDDPSLWTLTHPKVVRSIHERDLVAGADAVLTNTFGANRITLDRLGRAPDVVAINHRAVELARQAAGIDRFVIGSMGPEAAADFEATSAQVRALADAGADALILETHDRTQASCRLPWLRELTDMPILVTITETGATQPPPRPVDASPNTLSSWGTALGVVAFGSNCLPLEATLMRLTNYREGGSRLPLIARPAAGLPGGIFASPESFGAVVPRLLGLGVRVFGGCCGTTEGHISALRSALNHAL